MIMMPNPGINGIKKFDGTKLIKLAAIPAIILFLAISYDLAFSTPIMEKRVLVSKGHVIKSGNHLVIKDPASGTIQVHDIYNLAIYELVQPGDILLIKTTPFTDTWKNIEVFRHESSIKQESDISIFCALLLVLSIIPAYCFFPAFDIRNTNKVILVGLCEIISAAMLIAYLLEYHAH